MLRRIRIRLIFILGYVPAIVVLDALGMRDKSTLMLFGLGIAAVITVLVLSWNRSWTVSTTKPKRKRGRK